MALRTVECPIERDNLVCSVEHQPRPTEVLINPAGLADEVAVVRGKRHSEVRLGKPELLYWIDLAHRPMLPDRRPRGQAVDATARRTEPDQINASTTRTIPLRIGTSALGQVLEIAMWQNRLGP